MLGEKLIKKSDWIFISPIIGPGDRIGFFAEDLLFPVSMKICIIRKKVGFKQIFCASDLATLDGVRTQEENEAQEATRGSNNCT